MIGAGFNLLAQRRDFIDLSLRTNMGMPLRYFYKDVVVIDNRIDSIVYREQENQNSMRMVTFNGSLSLAVGEYIRGRTRHCK